MKPYIPDDLPLKEIDFRRLFKLAAEANAELARFDGLLQGIINSELLLAPLLTEEAVQSSKIEGTQATISDVLELEAGIEKPEHLRNDIQEIINYRKAMLFAKEYLQTRPVTLGFIRQLHQMLMQSVRGANKSPGKFRETQNYIGSIGCSLEEATFVPPDPVRLMTDLEAFERYLVNDDVEILLQTAVVHAQFELLHPFSDGNGRIGRLLIPLFLYQKQKLSQPTFYISNYLEKNRDSYYQRLNAISNKKDWNGWIEFFLKTVTYEAKNNSQKVKKIITLYDEMKKRVPEITHSQFSMQILDALFQRPLFRVNDFEVLTGVKRDTMKRYLKKLKDAGIIVESTPRKGRDSSLLLFPRLLAITDNIENITNEISSQ
jgi:Fic family protein